MTRPAWISASILSADFTQLGEQIRAAEAGGADSIHIDVMDGHFVPNLTMGPFVVEACRRITSRPLDVHLMIEAPERIIPSFAKAGASLIYVHVETCPNLHRTLGQIREAGCRAGVVLNPGTPAGAIEAVLHTVDVVLVMTVDPGYSGQVYQPEMLPKMAQVRQMLSQVNQQGLIAVDGGITAKTLPETRRAGADIFIAASAIFHYPEGIAKGIQALRAAVE